MKIKRISAWLATSDDDLRKLLQSSLKKAGFDVKLFTDAVSLVERLKKNRPDIFLIDFMLAKIDGGKLCNILKEDTRYAAVPVILLMSADAPQIIESTADIVLRKKDRENLHLKVIAAVSALINRERFPVELWEKADRSAEKVDTRSDEFFALKHRFDTVFEQNVSGILETDEKMDVISLNREMENIFKTPALDIVGRNLFGLFPEWKRDLSSLLKKPDNISNSAIIGHGDRFLEIKISPLGTKKKRIGYFIMFFDVTEKQLYQEKLLSYAEELEKEVQKRVNELKVTNIELERLNRMKTEFLSNVSHEMRTPLATIKGFTETLLHRNVGADESKEFLEIIASESSRLEKIVNEILDITKMQQGLLAKHLFMSKFDLVKEIEFIIKLLAPQAEKKKIQMKFDNNMKGLRITADRDRIRQVFINIIENALKFSPLGSNIRLLLEKDKLQAVFYCEDEGPGIPPEERNKVFEKFYMVDGSDRRIQKGTGVGLFIANEIVKLHNGSIEILPRRKKGSAFIVRLPLKIKTGRGTR